MTFRETKTERLAVKVFSENKFYFKSSGIYQTCNIKPTCTDMLYFTKLSGQYTLKFT